MSIVRNFNLYLNAGNGSAPYINVNQYDQGEQWVFTLYKEDGTKYTPSTGAIVGIKADNRGIINTGTVDADGRVVINETQQMTAAAGIAIFELLIDGDTHGTANFLVNVEQRPGDNADLSDSDLSLIQQAVDSAEVIVEVIGDSDPSEVIGEHVDAWLDNHPEATTTVEDGAITAPKINNSLWDKLLVSEEASGNPASFDDGADDVPVSSLKVALEPVQLGSGDPSPSNVRPIIASNGKNTLAPWVTSQTLDGITWTANSDGTFTTSGTASASSQPFSNNFTLPVGSYVLSGCPSGGSSSTYFLRLLVYNASNTLIANYSDYGSEVSFTLDATADHLRIFASVNSGRTAPSGTWKPMIRLALITDSTYQPYQGIMVERTGKNLLPPFVVNASWESGNATVVGTGDGAYKFNGTTTNYQQSVIQSDIHLKAGTYTFGATVEASGTPMEIGVQLRNVSGLITYAIAYWNSPAQTFTLTEDTAVRMRFVVQSALTFNNVIFKPQIEYSSEATEYEPFTSTSYPYTLGQSVYGGTVDLATGVLTVDRTLVDMGSLNWSASSTAHCFYANFGTYPQYKISSNVQFICSQYKYDGTRNASPYFGDNGTLRAYSRVNASSPSEIYVRDDRFTAVADFKTAVTGQTICYELETPQTIQLTLTEVKTLLGYNNISSTGTVDVIYHADTKLYVDKMTNVDNAIIAPTEEGFTATRNYTVNDLVIVNDTLYKVTANIASGSAITPNSNVTATTLSALIKALS